MARSARQIKTSFITLYPSAFLDLISSTPLLSSFLLISPRKSPRNKTRLCSPPNLSLLFLTLIISLSLFAISKIRFIHITPHNHLTQCNSKNNNNNIISPSLSSVANYETDPNPKLSSMVPLPALGVFGNNITHEEREFWKQPDNEGFKPCLDFSLEYRKKSVKITKENRKFLIAVVSGGLNQQRNQIVDAVVIARILEAALVIPILQVNLIWRDDSEFSDIFDVEHFKSVLQADVRVVFSLPSTHLNSRQSIERKLPHGASPHWIRARFAQQLNEEGVLLLKGLESKLLKNLPPDLQKLRCKVAFHALRFASPIRNLGNRLARRLWIEGPYIALHLRLEKDVFVRTGCLTGLGLEFDDIITQTRESHPEYLTRRLNMTHVQRRLAGLCPLNALEIARLLKGLGAPRSANIYNAGGEPFGGRKALEPLFKEFPNLVNKYMLAREGELSPFVNKSSALAAIDYIISFNSDVFVPSHGGNMGRVMQGHRAYVGHRKYIKPNKRMMLPVFENAAISEEEMGRIVRDLHSRSQGQPELRTKRRDGDVIAYPIPDCMCK